MTEQEILNRLETIGALIRNSHIVYTSGRHGRAYVNKDALYPHTELTHQITGEMAKSCAQWQPQVVVAPALGGIVLSQWIGSHLSRLLSREVPAVYAEKDPDGGGFLLRRGYDRFVKGKKTLVLEDVLTTGGSVRQVIDCVRRCGGDVVGVSVLCNRGNLSAADLDVPRLNSLIKVNFESWPAEECPLCRQGVEIDTRVGKGLEFLKSRA